MVSSALVSFIALIMQLGDTQERNAPAQVRFFDDLNISQISAGNEHIAVLTKAGEVFTVGFNGSG
jgi:alpha-tubulin suppressor-like RCC1 family protein